MMLEKDLEWDPVTEQIINIPEANRYLSRSIRAPWDAVYREYEIKNS
jgi:hypothetical protein